MLLKDTRDKGGLTLIEAEIRDATFWNNAFYIMHAWLHRDKKNAHHDL